LVIGLNPSTADENVDDRTVKKCEQHEQQNSVDVRIIDTDGSVSTLP